MGKLSWTDADEIGYRLAAAHPAVDPLTVRFADLRAMVLALDGLAGDPAASSEGALEAIQMAWLEEYRDNPCGR